MKRRQRENLIDCLFGIVCGIAVVVFGWLLLNWFHDGGAELLLRLGGAL